jgi:predicted TIM-barrel fold metal-dependent hydrolase
MIIDCQSHVFPEAYAQLLTRNRGILRTEGSAGRYRVDYGGLQQFTLDLERYSPRAKLAAMDAAGVDISVLSVNIPGPEWLAPELALEGARLCNDHLAELCLRHPSRFMGLASLPLGDVPATIAELRRAVGELGLRGILLPSHIGEKPVDADSFEPFYAEVEALDVPVVLHPTVPSWGRVVRDYEMIPMFGFMVDTSIAMLRLILGGVLERHPGLIVVHPHAGGVLPYLMGRVIEQTEVKRRGRERITRSPAEYYSRVYLDLVTPSVLAMRYAYDFAGPDRLLFGSDHPWVEIGALRELVARLDVPETDRARILGLNAAKLFDVE